MLGFHAKFFCFLALGALLVPLARADELDSQGQWVIETPEAIAEHADPADVAPPLPGDEDDTPAEIQAEPSAGVGFPAFSAAWGLSRSVYDHAVSFRRAHAGEFSNQRYAVLIDMNKHSSQRRFFLFDLQTGKIEKHVVAHGRGSDPSATGYAKYFSNVTNSEKTSLGAYRTLGTYHGAHGTQLRLEGLEGSNSQALTRGLVVHGAPYVSDGGHSGRSEGCPALDPRVVGSVIRRIESGAMLVIWR